MLLEPVEPDAERVAVARLDVGDAEDSEEPQPLLFVNFVDAGCTECPGCDGIVVGSRGKSIKIKTIHILLQCIPGETGRNAEIGIYYFSSFQNFALYFLSLSSSRTLHKIPVRNADKSN